MRAGARRVSILTLGAVVAAALVGPAATPAAWAQAEPTPTPSPSPTPTPSPTPKPSPKPSPNPSPDPSPNPSPAPSPAPDPTPSPPPKRDPLAAPLPLVFLPPATPSSGIYGIYDSSGLVRVARKLRRLGVPRRVVLRVYAPFILAGRAEWWNSWGYPRAGHGRFVRAHEGQDVFCDHGTPVLAAEKGEVSFGTGGLGGLVARVHLKNGSYLYYAHLSDLKKGLKDGDRVRSGDVLGFCGDSGNASGGSPHVHFGLYSGVAYDPMPLLVKWLERAERQAHGLLARTRARLERRDALLRLSRALGDSWQPDLTELELPDPEAPESIGDAAALLATVDDLDDLPAEVEVAGDVEEPGE
jgi:murein DD-endopeptidase MepM/ murein hydrolase activator NlpD